MAGGGVSARGSVRFLVMVYKRQNVTILIKTEELTIKNKCDATN